MQSSSQIIITNKPTFSFLQTWCPSCRPTNSVKALKGKYYMHLLTPSSPGSLPTLSLTNNSSWLPWGRVAMPLISPLMPVPQQPWSTWFVHISSDTSRSLTNTFSLAQHHLQWRAVATVAIAMHICLNDREAEKCWKQTSCITEWSNTYKSKWKLIERGLCIRKRMHLHSVGNKLFAASIFTTKYSESAL